MLSTVICSTGICFWNLDARGEPMVAVQQRQPGPPPHRSQYPDNPRTSTRDRRFHINRRTAATNEMAATPQIDKTPMLVKRSAGPGKYFQEFCGFFESFSLLRLNADTASASESGILPQQDPSALRSDGAVGRSLTPIDDD